MNLNQSESGAMMNSRSASANSLGVGVFDLGRRMVCAALLVLVSTTASAWAADGTPLDRTGLITTFADEFDTFEPIDPHTPASEQIGTWKTWHPFGATPFALVSRTFPRNGEMQVYIDRHFPTGGQRQIGERAHTVQDGILSLRAEPARPEMRRRIFGRRYTSAMISTWGSFSQRYGLWEIRAKFPAGKGLWPAFWLLPDNSGGPPELDVFEFLGHTPNTLHTTFHSNAGGRRAGGTREVRTPNLTEAFHTYAVEWTPQNLIYYFDDVEVARFRTPADMHRPMYMIANLAVGGSWPGAPDAYTVFPAALQIDWIRVHRRPTP